MMSVAGCVYNPNASIVEEYGIEYSLYQSFAESTKVKAEKKDSIGNFTVALKICNLESAIFIKLMSLAVISPSMVKSVLLQQRQPVSPSLILLLLYQTLVSPRLISRQI